MSRKPLPVRTAVVRCAGIGLTVGLLYCGWVTVVYLFHGDSPFTKAGTSLGDVIAVYLLSGTVGGAWVGLMWRMARVRVVAYLTSLVIASILAIGVGMALWGMPARWDAGTVVGLVIFALFFGLFWGGPLHKAVLEKGLDW